jgi:hypothetical protein
MNSYNCYTNRVVRIRTRCGFLYQFIHFLYELYSTNSYNEPGARGTPGCPNQLGCVHGGVGLEMGLRCTICMLPVGWRMAVAATIASHIGPGLKSQPGFFFFH